MKSKQAYKAEEDRIRKIVNQPKVKDAFNKAYIDFLIFGGISTEELTDEFKKAYEDNKWELYE
jgi:hypothetical protein